MQNTKNTKKSIIKDKFGGKCAYTGKDLGDDWQIDHVESKNYNKYKRAYIAKNLNDLIQQVDSNDNLVPALRIVNHYKRGFNLEGFRDYMLSFHKRLAKLPKKTRLEKTKKRIKYMNEVANAFDISVDKPFGGIFYFESFNNTKEN